MNKRKTKRVKYDGKMDEECIALCDAINALPGLRTVLSCCGHGRRPFRIWLIARSLTALPPLLGCLREFHWGCEVETDETASIPRFVIEGPIGEKASREAKHIAKRIKSKALLVDIHSNRKPSAVFGRR